MMISQPLRASLRVKRIKKDTATRKGLKHMQKREAQDLRQLMPRVQGKLHMPSDLRIVSYKMSTMLILKSLRS